MAIIWAPSSSIVFSYAVNIPALGGGLAVAVCVLVIVPLAFCISICCPARCNSASRPRRAQTHHSTNNGTTTPPVIIHTTLQSETHRSTNVTMTRILRIFTSTTPAAASNSPPPAAASNSPPPAAAASNSPGKEDTASYPAQSTLQEEPPPSYSDAANYPSPQETGAYPGPPQ